MEQLVDGGFKWMCNKNRIHLALFILSISVLISFLTVTFPLRLVFAIIIMPFIIFYGIINKRFLIMLNILGLILFSRAFAHLNIRIGILPIYVTEAVLVITIGILFLDKLLARYKINYLKNIPLKKEFALFYLIGFIYLIKGFIQYSPLLTLRHSAMIYYSVFYFLIPILFNNLKRIEMLFKLTFIACIIITITSLLNVNFQINEYGGLGGFSYFYLSLAVIFESFYLKYLKKRENKIFLLLIIFLQLYLVLISQSRATWVALLVSCFFIIYLSFRKGKLDKHIIRVFTSLLFIAIISISSVGILNPSLFNRLKTEAATIVFFNRIKDVSSDNTQWRLLIWKDMVKDISKKPLFGWGFGKGFYSSSLDKKGWLSGKAKKRGWTDPHNSFLNLVYKTGIIGFFVFLLIIIKFFTRAMRFIRYICYDEKIKLYVMALLVCFVYILVIAFFMVVLEGPFLGSFLWIVMGLVVALEKIYREQNRSIENHI